MTGIQSALARLPGRFLERFKITFFATFFVLLVCLSLIAVEGWLTWRARAIQLDATAVSSSNLAESVAQHAYDTVKEADTILVGLVDRLETDAMPAAALERMHNLLAHHVSELPQLHGIYVFDRNGRCLVSSLESGLTENNSAGLEYFMYHRAHTERRPHIGPPVRTQFFGEWVINISYRLERPDGSFAGVVLASIDTAYFKRYYERFDIGRMGAIFLALDNGIVLVRRPFGQQSIGRDISNLPLFRDYLPTSARGTATITSGQDGITRINSYRHMRQYPLVVSAALARDEALDEWRADAYRHGGAVGLLVLVLGWLGFRLVRQIRLRTQAEAGLLQARNALEILNRSLEKLAMLDGLTGLANRRCFDSALHDEFNRALRDAGTLALIIIDVDHFKQYNDIYGHAQGDECLKAIATTIAASQNRAGDLAARYGGEEFVVLLPGTDRAGAVVIADAIRLAIHRLGQPHAGNATGVVTVSAGVDAFNPVTENHHPLDLIVAADKALYQAKSGGRNRVGA